MTKIGGLLLALLALAWPTAATTQEADPTPFFIDLELIERIDCVSGVGSGARIDAEHVITAYHVIAGRPNCLIDGQPTTVAHIDPARDFAVLKTPVVSDLSMVVSCDLPKRGEEYFAIGYAFGERFVVQRLTGTGKTKRTGQFKGLKIFQGKVFPGNSGGPIVNKQGHIVALVNAGNPVGTMMGRSLRETYLCAEGNG